MTYQSMRCSLIGNLRTILQNIPKCVSVQAPRYSHALSNAVGAALYFLDDSPTNLSSDEVKRAVCSICHNSDLVSIAVFLVYATGIAEYGGNGKRIMQWWTFMYLKPLDITLSEKGEDLVKEEAQLTWLLRAQESFSDLFGCEALMRQIECDESGFGRYDGIGKDSLCGFRIAIDVEFCPGGFIAKTFTLTQGFAKFFRHLRAEITSNSATHNAQTIQKVLSGTRFFSCQRLGIIVGVRDHEFGCDARLTQQGGERPRDRLRTATRRLCKVQ
jgi:hypothetical protein